MPHPALEIPEILSIISTYLTRRNALRMAFTCRAFSDAALDVAWEEIWSFEPLVRCLPDDLWRVQTVFESRKKPRFDSEDEEDGEDGNFTVLVSTHPGSKTSAYLTTSPGTCSGAYPE